MNITLWIIASLVAAVFLLAGASKVLQPKSKLAESGQGWVEPYPSAAVKLIGGLEVAAAIGLILPAVIDVAPILVPVAAVGLVLLMIGAAITHARRGEVKTVPVNLLLLALAAVVAWGRFGPYSF